MKLATRTLLAALLERLSTCPQCGQPGKHNLDPRGFFDVWSCRPPTSPALDAVTI
jgi:hypothetical protein